ncbi:MAG: neutral/alkaline non-lysosomal ceramidase N-terminal domain-containing protein [Actinomycetota bacterium]|nr:neutral/alkaline non-lysosomal ceramidase N-terminal domain-containing protein [Actinomycetota bacterium]
MRKRCLSFVVALGIAVFGFPLAQAPAQEVQAPGPGAARAGIAVVDATWHVGSSAGQHASEGKDTNEVDPHSHAFKTRNSYGVNSRLTVRALVVEGSNGDRVALVKTDNYLAQDLLQRRVGQILEDGPSGVTYDDVLLSASHNHSSPYHVTPAVGPWIFTDVFDLRMFEYQARRIAEAIETAASSMVPVRMGATTVPHSIFKGNVPGPSTADDGTPGGFPKKYGDAELVIVRFDDISNPSDPVPLANWVNFGQHPESLDGYNLLTADFLGPLERFVGRETGAPLVYTQADVGSAEGPGDEWRRNADGTVEAWYHRGFANAERGARYLADSIVQGFGEIGSGGGEVPFTSSFPVAIYSAWVPGPVSHPYPGYGNCRTQTTVEGNPGSPSAPDCVRPGSPKPFGAVWQNLKAHGLPVPENYTAPAFMGVEENLRLRLQAVRLGDIILASCSCEAQVDIIKNFESRANATVGDIHDGYQWNCTPDAPEPDPNKDHPWTCEDPSDPSGIRKFTFSDNEWKRALAQIHNDADGWDAPENAPFANAEPADITKIRGNFTKEELSDADGVGTPGAGGTTPGQIDIIPVEGYKIAVGMGHTGDYLGYTVSYREYMNRDHYRKSLTSYGPHTADYMSTRMVWLAAELKDGDNGKNDFADPLTTDPYYKLQAADEVRQEATAQLLGRASSHAYDVWMQALPNDVGPAAGLVQPKNITRFNAATFTWRGGSNAVDNPTVVVQSRNEDGGWDFYADQTGEVQTFLDFPNGIQGVADTYSGRQEWKWTANFEAFNFGPRDDIDPRSSQVPAGDYRFVVDGVIRQGGRDTPYEIASEPFTVTPWEGIRVSDMQLQEDGSVTFRVSGADQQPRFETGSQPDWPIRYPRTYDQTSDIPFIKDDGSRVVCRTCSFRPWAIGSAVDTAQVTVESEQGTTTIAATCDITGACRANGPIYSGDRAFVARGGIVDTYGEINGEPSAAVTGTAPRPDPDPTEEQPHDTSVDFTLASEETGQYSDGAFIEARLVDDVTGEPIGSAELTFTLTGPDDSRDWTATTGADGVAGREIDLTQRPEAYQLVVRYLGDDGHEPTANQTGFVIDKEDTTTTLTTDGQGSRRRLTARVADHDNDAAGVAEVVVHFFADGTAIGSATTDRDGVARFSPPPKYRNGRHLYEAKFEGNDYYRGSSGVTAD